MPLAEKPISYAVIDFDNNVTAGPTYFLNEILAVVPEDKENTLVEIHEGYSKPIYKWNVERDAWDLIN